jgi:hypothetical protein
MLLSAPESTKSTLTLPDSVTPAKAHYLRDLVLSVPIRGPSLV